MFLHTPVFSLLPPGLLLNLKRSRRERQRENHERMRASEVEGGLREKDGGRRNRRKKSGKRFQAGKDEETQAKTGSQNRQVKSGCRCWQSDASSADSLGSQGVQVEICQTV